MIDQLEKDLIKINSTKVGRRAFVAALPLILAGCASTGKGRLREGSNSGQSTSLTVADEQKMAKDYLPKMEKEYPTIKNDYIQKHINYMGQKIVSQNGLGANPYNYTFTAVESKQINAFALPAGTVYVTAPLIAMAGSEAELSGVLGHEIGHIMARHTAERIDKAKKEESKSLFYGIGGAILGGVAGFGLGKLICSKEDRECLRRIALYGGGAGVAGGLLIQKFAFMANSREDEMEADRIGFKTSMKAGYHPQYVGSFYKKLLNMESKYKGSQNALTKSFADALSTHPPGKERVAQMDQMASQFGGSGIITTKEFTKIKELCS